MGPRGVDPRGLPPTGWSPPTLEVGKATTRPRFWTPGRFSGEAVAAPPFGATVDRLRWSKLFSPRVIRWTRHNTSRDASNDHVFELFEPFGGYRPVIGAPCYLTVVRAGYGQTVDLAHGIDQKTCNIRAIVARNCGCGAVRARESLTTAGDYAIFHGVRSR